MIAALLALPAAVRASGVAVLAGAAMVVWSYVSGLHDDIAALETRLAVEQAAAAALSRQIRADRAVIESLDAIREDVPHEGSALDPVLHDLLDRLRAAADAPGGAR